MEVITLPASRLEPRITESNGIILVTVAYLKSRKKPCYVSKHIYCFIIRENNEETDLCTNLLFERLAMKSHFFSKYHHFDAF